MSNDIEVRRRPDGTALKPRAEEPSCIHSTSVEQPTQPASACRFCKDGAELERWQVEWASWLSENPDSPEAQWFRAKVDGA